MDIWGGGHKRTHTRDYHYKGRTKEHFFNRKIRSGAEAERVNGFEPRPTRYL